MFNIWCRSCFVAVVVWWQRLLYLHLSHPTHCRHKVPALTLPRPLQQQVVCDQIRDHCSNVSHISGHPRKKSPALSKAVEEPCLDPKYLPHMRGPEGTAAAPVAHRTPPVDPLSSVTPGVLRPPAAGRGGGRGRGGRGRGEKRGNAEQVPLLSAYFPNS